MEGCRAIQAYEVMEYLYFYYFYLIMHTIFHYLDRAIFFKSTQKYIKKKVEYIMSVSQ